MDTSELRRSELVGLIAAVVLIGSLFGEWFSLETDPSIVERSETDENDWVCGIGNGSCSAFDTFPILRWLLLAAASAPIILAYLVMRGTRLSWPRGEVTAIVGLTAFVLIAYNGIIDRPNDGLEVSLSYGYWIALLASLGIFLAGGFRAVESGGGGRRKPPATF
ncbi:MAG: hypothetical protein ACRDL6_01515 [Solirubrobacterales bacterium]